MGRGVIFGVAMVSLAVACGFPDVSYAPAGDTDGDAATGVEGSMVAESGSGSGEGAAGDTGGADDDASGADAEGGPAGDTGTASDASGDTGPADTGAADTGAGDGPPMDAPADAPPDCDVDGDGYRATGALCNGNDCCDTDKTAHPGQTAYFPTADACGSFDYDCVNGEEPEYATSIACTGTGLTGCHGGPGFIGAPACGQSGPWGTCQGSGALACQPVATMNIPQSCR